MKHQNRESGFALVVTLLILVVLSIMVVGVYQSSILSILVSQNTGDQPIALGYASTCEGYQARQILNFKMTPFSIVPGANPLQVNCSSTQPQQIDLNCRVAGSSASLCTQIQRFRTTGSGRRNATVTMVTDVALVFNKPN